MNQDLKIKMLRHSIGKHIFVSTFLTLLFSILFHNASAQSIKQNSIVDSLETIVGSWTLSIRHNYGQAEDINELIIIKIEKDSIKYINAWIDTFRNRLIFYIDGYLRNSNNKLAVNNSIKRYQEDMFQRDSLKRHTGMFSNIVIKDDKGLTFQRELTINDKKVIHELNSIGSFDLLKGDEYKKQPPVKSKKRKALN